MIDIKKIERENQIRLSNAYLALEVEQKTAQVCKKYGLKCYTDPEYVTFTHWPDSNETRSLTHILWQLFEYLDEVLNIKSIQVHHFEDSQSIDITGFYINSRFRFRLEVYYSTLETCKVEMVDTVVKKAKLTCI